MLALSSATDCDLSVGMDGLRADAIKGNELAFAWRESGKQLFGKTTLSTPNRDSNLDLPVIDILVYCESSALDHAVTEAGVGVF
uniref:Uncharacterized protein n=1 Tax=Timema bartmani TaxID=61472 RepID=A0A7R9EWU0_9NEOP|nr:unnamed protein product [Timema bartmani]